jgi:DNA-binding NarL/FixJ family response regulator
MHPSKPETNTNSISIVIADDHYLILEGISIVLKNYDHLRLVGQATNGEELLKLVEIHQPQVVITDIRMPVMDGIVATRCIKNRFPEIEVLALTAMGDDLSAANILLAGAKGFLFKGAGERDIVEAIEKVSHHEYAYCTEVANRIVQLTKLAEINPSQWTERPHFNDKELKIIQGTCQQLSNKEIARELNMDTRCVERTKERIQKKTGARNMVGIALFAIKNGIFRID